LSSVDLDKSRALPHIVFSTSRLQVEKATDRTFSRSEPDGASIAIAATLTSIKQDLACRIVDQMFALARSARDLHVATTATAVGIYRRRSYPTFDTDTTTIDVLIHRPASLDRNS
jgi:hypothetical protein